MKKFMLKPEGFRLVDEAVHKRTLQKQCNSSTRFHVRATKTLSEKPATTDSAPAFCWSNSLSSSQVKIWAPFVCLWRAKTLQKERESLVVDSNFRQGLEIKFNSYAFQNKTKTKPRARQKRQYRNLDFPTKFGLRHIRDDLSVLGFGKGPSVSRWQFCPQDLGPTELELESCGIWLWSPLQKWTTELNSGAIQLAKQHDRHTGAKPCSLGKQLRFKYSGRTLGHLVVSLLRPRWFNPAGRTVFWMTRAPAQARTPRTNVTMTQINLKSNRPCLEQKKHVEQKAVKKVNTSKCCC